MGYLRSVLAVIPGFWFFLSTFCRTRRPYRARSITHVAGGVPWSLFRMSCHGLHIDPRLPFPFLLWSAHIVCSSAAENAASCIPHLTESGRTALIPCSGVLLSGLNLLPDSARAESVACIYDRIILSLFPSTSPYMSE